MTGLTLLPLPEHSTSNKRFQGSPRILGPSWSHFPILTVSLLGVQIFWSVEMGYASPYLLSLGLSKSSMAMVFLAGPLSGLVMQPLIGVLADNSTSRFGRRRPYMLLGTILCVFGMLLLGYTRAIAAVFTGWDNSKNDSLTTILAIIAIYIVDFSINAVQALDRALLVDTLPSSLQPTGNAWAAGMLGFGAVIGFFIGTVPLPTVFPFLGTTELQVLSIIVCLLLLSGQVTMAVCVKERVLIESNRASFNKHSAKRPSAFVREIRDLWNHATALPRVIRQIFIIQFFAWIAWFPLLFYTTIYVGDLYKRSTPPFDSPPIPGSSTSSSEESLKMLINARDAEATRLGSLSLFYSSILSLFMNIVAPMFVAAAAAKHSSSVTPHSYTARREGALGALGDEIGSARVGGSGGFREDETRSGWRSHGEGGGWRSRIGVPERMKVRLVSLWAISHLVLACCMLGTLFTNSVTGATLIITVTGFSWAITQWAPFTLLAEAILTEPDPTLTNIPGSIRLADTRTLTNGDDATGDTERDGFLTGDLADSGSDDGSEDGTGAEGKTHISGLEANGNGVLGNLGARVSRVEVSLAAGEDDEIDEHGNGVGKPGGLSSKAGSILGLHNIFIVIPQFLVVGLSAIMFAIFDPAQAPKAGVMPPPSPVPSSLVNTHANSTDPSGEQNRAAVKLIRHAMGAVARNIGTARAAEAAGGDEKGGQSNSVVYVFRIGGIAALIAFILCWRLARELRHR